MVCEGEFSVQVESQLADSGWGEDGKEFAVKLSLECRAGVRSSLGEVHEVALVGVDGHANSGKGVDHFFEGFAEEEDVGFEVVGNG